MKIAVFLYFYPSTERVYVSSLIDMLIKLGHEVSIFSFFIDDLIFIDKNSNITKGTRNTISFLFKRIYTKTRNLFCLFFPFVQNYFLKIENKYKLYNDLRYIIRKLKNKCAFDFSIGIEKGGVICAHQLYKLHNIPFYYLSLELYDDTHPFLKIPSMFKAMRVMEIDAHKKAKGTIIADKYRKDFLYKTGKIDTAKPAFFLPISFNEDNLTNELSFIKIDNDCTKKIILNFGYNRIPDDFFISMIKKMSRDFIFFMHHSSTAYHEEIAHKYSLENVCFSNSFLNEKDIMVMIKKSFIGVCWYQDKVANDRLIAFSSEKTARYLAAGKPIIANAKTNFSELFSSIKCGIAVNFSKEFIDALHIITNNYQEFSIQARRAFELFYKLSNYQQSLNNFLLENLKI
jgi:glycosyltransferase involved in cell wall biosynthesis